MTNGRESDNGYMTSRGTAEQYLPAERNEKYYKLIERLDFNYLYVNCPLEITDALSVYDIDTYDYYLHFIFRSMSETPVDSVDIIILLYDNANVPSEKIPYTYSFEAMRMNSTKRKNKGVSSIACGAEFGRGFYIPIPQSYFKKLNVVIKRISYSDQTAVEYEEAAKYSPEHLSSLSLEKKNAFDQINIYEALEDEFPTKFVAAEGQFSWMCCCGNKNPNNIARCSRCGRAKDWQLCVMSDKALDEEHEKYIKEHSALFANYAKAEFMIKHNYISKQDRLDMAEKQEIALNRVEKQEKRRERLMKQIIPRFVLYFAIMTLIYLFFRWLSMYT
ncbi:MAG: hypothetical protein VB118_06970 [Oscillospiraceae bacterium]|nr:hypothetical protein [Oscillospiraceae bacterium]